MITVHLLQAFPEVRETYRRRFRHVLVDEYQDTNHAQYALIHQLCADRLEETGRRLGAERVEPAELMVVGDADQSIYAFRGANIRNILDFEQDFPNATSILLEQNYRSTQTILTAANAVIGHNKGRKEKRLWSDAGDGERIVGYVADDEHDEARFVSEEIDKLTDEGELRPGDVAVFYRTNAQSRVFEEVFIRTGQPYKVVGGVRFYERREVRDALAYLRMLVNPADEVSLRRILNTPKRGIGDRAVACVQALADRDRIDLLGGAAARRRGARAGHPVADRDPGLRRDGRGAAVDGRRRRARRRRARDRAGPLRLPRPGSRSPTTRRTRPGWRTSPSWSPWPASSPTTRWPARRPTRPTSRPASSRPGSPTSSSGSRWSPTPTRSPTTTPTTPGVVTLMTLHTAKGLEFPVVFLTGLEDGVFPHSRALGDQTELEEERRLAYVGVTRARERLYISRAVVRSAWGAPSHNPGSRFLDELPVDLVDWRRTEAAQTQWEPPRPRRAARPAPARCARPRPGRRNFSAAAVRADAAARAKPAREIPSLEPGDRVLHDSFGMGTVVALEGVGRQDRRLDRLRLRGRQAAAAALRAGREALSARRRSRLRRSSEVVGRAVGTPVRRRSSLERQGCRPCTTSAAYGSTGSPPPGRTSRCRCGPVTLPVEPT